MNLKSLRFSLPLALAAAAFLAAACGPGDADRGPGTHAVVIGIDGADWQVIEALAADGGMPNLMRLRERGAWGPIATLTDIPLSPVIWTSVATGKSAKKHGITWFMVDRPDGTRVPVRSHNRRVKAIWNLLAEQGRKASAVGWWASYPAEDIGLGVMVSDALGFHGFGATAAGGADDAKIHPPELYPRFAARVPAVETIGVDFARRFLNLSEAEWAAEHYVPARHARPDPQNPIHLFQQYAATAQGYAAITEDLLERRDDDLTMVYFEQVDSFSHLFMKYAPPRLEWIDEAGYARYRDVVAEWYRYQDELLGRLLAKIDLDETAVFILSDHGFKSGERRIHSDQTIDVRRAHLDHERDGIFLAAGPHVRPGKIEGASVLDLTPTVLHYLGLPVARDMDGRVLERLFDRAFREANPIRRIDSYESPDVLTQIAAAAAQEEAFDADELAATEEALRALGYLGDAEGTDAPAGERTAGTPAPATPAATVATAAATPPAPTPPASESSPEIHNNLGRIHLRDGELDEARAQFERALALSPRNAEALLNLGSIHRVQGRIGQAQHFVERALRVDPNSIGALAQLAAIQRQRGEHDESIRLYREAMAIDDSQPFLHLGLGDSLQRAGRYDEAETAFRTVLGLDPDSFEAHYNLGVTDLQRGRLDAAAGAFEKALALDARSPRAAMAYNNLGDLHLRRGERGPAIEKFRRATEVAPGHLESRYNLGVLKLQEGASAEAVGWLEQAAAIEPNHEAVNASLGMAYLLAGRNADAHRSFLLVRRLYPQNWVSALGLSLLHAGAGEKARAQDLLADALRHGGEAARAEAGNYPVLQDVLAGIKG